MEPSGYIATAMFIDEGSGQTLFGILGIELNRYSLF